jgi:hypothetical protein
LVKRETGDDACAAPATVSKFDPENSHFVRFPDRDYQQATVSNHGKAIGSVYMTNLRARIPALDKFRKYWEAVWMEGRFQVLPQLFLPFRVINVPAGSLGILKPEIT